MNFPEILKLFHVFPSRVLQNIQPNFSKKYYIQKLSKIIHGLLNRVPRLAKHPTEIIAIILTLPGIAHLKIIKNNVSLKTNIHDSLERSFFVLLPSSFGIRYIVQSVANMIV